MTVSISLVPIISMVWYHSILLCLIKREQISKLFCLYYAAPFLSCGLKLSQKQHLTFFTMKINLLLEFLTYASECSFL